MDRKVSVIGLGYVGLPVAVAFGNKNQVIAFDINQKRIEELSKGHDHTLEITKTQLDASDLWITSNSTILSDLGEKVLLIDADMRKGYLHKIFSRQQSPGLSEYLSGKMSLEKTIQKVLPNVDFISTGHYPDNPAELLMHHNLSMLIESVTAQYDIVIIDTPPILAVTDASLLLKHSGIRLLIVGSGKDHLKEIEHAKGVLNKSGITLDGIICNNLKDQGKKESGGYGYNYHYQYK